MKHETGEIIDVRRLRSTLALALALLTGAACGFPFRGGDDPQVRTSPEPGWRLCPEVARELLGHTPRDFTIECRDVTVPQDWNHPDDGHTIDISLLRARSVSQRKRIGSLLVNPGGPGGSGVDLAVYLTTYPLEEVTERFDLVGFDPRGVGRSSPVECFSDDDLDASFAADPDPVTQAAFDKMVADTKRMVGKCGSAYGDTLGLYSTEQAAQDMDAIRTTLGDEKLTYLGYSYGTLLGAVYAQLHPDKVRALVLDGAVDPTQDGRESSESQAKGFERAFDNWAAWCEDNAGRCHLSGSPRAVVTKLMDGARRQPLVHNDGRTATAGWIFWAVVSSLYTTDRWPDLAEALADLENGDPAGVFKLADSYAEREEDGGYTNLFDANAAVNCADESRPQTVDSIRRLQSTWRDKYPLFGAPLAVGMLTCSLWPGGRDPFPAGRAEGAPPIVVVGTTGDPATPYEQTATLAGMLGVGTVLTWEGEGHTAYPESSCITSAVNAYLIDLKVPPAGKTCR